MLVRTNERQRVLAKRMTRQGTESAFEVLVRARELEAAGKDVVHLEIVEPDFATPANIVNAAVGKNDPSAELGDILRANGEFHRRLSELAGNQRVTAQLSLTLAYVTRLDTLCTQTVPGWIAHADILRAIEVHDPAAAREAMAQHIDHSRDKMINLFGREPAEVRSFDWPRTGELKVGGSFTSNGQPADSAIDAEIFSGCC